MSRPQDAIPKLSRGESVEVAQKDGESASGEALPEGWADVELGEVCKHITDGSHAPPKAQESGLPMLGAKNVSNGGFSFENPRWITPEAFEKEDRRTDVQPNDVLLITVGATLGRSTVVPEGLPKFTLQRSVGVIKPIELDPHFVSFQLRSPEFQRYFERTAKGTAQKGIYLKTLSGTSIKVAPKAEQSRIVSAIESLQERSSRARVLLSEVGSLIGQLRQSVLHDAFSGKLTADWRARRRMGTPESPSPPAPSEENSGLGAQATNPAQETASELLLRIRTERRERWQSEQLAKYEAKGKQPPKNWQDKYKEPEPVDESELPQLPDGWCWANLEELAAYQKNAIKAGPFGSSLKKAFYVESGYKIYGQEQVINGDPYFGDYYIDQERFDLLKSCEVQPGDLLVSLVGTIGRTLVLPDDIEPGIINPRLIKITLNPKIIHPPFLQYYFRAPSVLEIFSRISHGGTMEILNMGTLKKLAYPVAPLAEQIEVVSRIEEAIEGMESVSELQASMESSLTQLDQSILSKAFRGELVPQDPRDEPASELLARIRTTREKLEAEKKAKKKSKTRKKKTEAEA